MHAKLLGFTLVSSLLALGALAESNPSTPGAAETLPQVPSFSTATYDGRPVEWSSLVGKVYLVDFWATWCNPCHETLPELQAIHAKLATAGDFSVLGMTLERGAAGTVRARKLADSLGVTYPLYNDAGTSGRAHHAFGVNGIPDLFLVDAEGRIVQRWVGSDTNFQEVEKMTRALLEKTRAQKSAG